VTLRVAVAGGGLGGLCLAQGLLRAGAEVTVYERDAGLDARRQGYRLHLDARAGLALERCLPPALLRLLLATCGEPSRRMTVVSERLRVLHQMPTADPAADLLAPATLSVPVHRQTLREVLAGRLDERIAFDHEVIRYEADSCSARLHFAGGGQAEADLLIGADGVNSAVRRQYLPAVAVTDTGARCVYGRTPLRDDTLRLLPAPVGQGFMAVIGRGVGMATGLMRLPRPPGQAAAAIAPGVRLSPADSYLMWAVTAQRGRFGLPADELSKLGPQDLHALSATMIRSWHPDLRALHGLADISETFLVPIRVTEPVPAWPPSRVTVLGDAVHAMSPARGSGANTALQDAGLLCGLLTEAAAEGTSLLAAVGEYERQMREYGYAAVAASRKAEAQTGVRGSGLMSWLHGRLARADAAG
jgi:2-polyprenyl-6-methoxyphenol hydroxylase-like FAD-dependent oxidoreductase